MSVSMHILIRDTGHHALILKCIRFDIGLSQQTALNNSRDSAVSMISE